MGKRMALPTHPETPEASQVQRTGGSSICTPVCKGQHRFFGTVCQGIRHSLPQCSARGVTASGTAGSSRSWAGSRRAEGAPSPCKAGPDPLIRTRPVWMSRGTQWPVSLLLRVHDTVGQCFKSHVTDEELCRSRNTASQS